MLWTRPEVWYLHIFAFTLDKCVFSLSEDIIFAWEMGRTGTVLQVIFFFLRHQETVVWLKRFPHSEDVAFRHHTLSIELTRTNAHRVHTLT